MFNINAIQECVLYPDMKKFYQGDYESDLVDALEFAKKPTNTDLTEGLNTIHGNLAKEDELSNIYDELFVALKLNKPEMIERIKKVLTMLEDKNMEFCNTQSHCSSIINDLQ